MTKRPWRLSLLLGFASLILLIELRVQWHVRGLVEALLDGAIFDAGFYVGKTVLPNYAVRGTTGFYAAPLFGVAAVFLTLVAFWFVCIRLLRCSRAESHDEGRIQGS